MDTYRAIRDAELTLLTSTVRRDAEQVCRLLHPEFVEIGRSGRRWTHEEILVALAGEDAGDTPVVEDWDFQALTGELTLVTYLIHGSDGDSRHSSLWDTSTGAPVMRFHQGTMISQG